ncbi:ABC transporter ATP-binding protein [Cellulomonas chitinilytica]|uniref:ABC transporter ATP-binding protein n=1 Tax=Cellulomonas chitinilytica TaxID=398759 RepID=A0A919NY71_9CELL|nr:ABC transporter ATP-binding protein [Cellulomonas chitinilytica]GIG19692.1 ABC transporter ATP-binding protein [Cellulomonas chitinilytica]
MSRPALEVRDVTKTYVGHPPTPVLHGVDLSVGAGERVAIFGSSGSGKSTLLNILGLLDVPTSGAYDLLGQDTCALSSSTRAKHRASALGFVFQEHHVLGARTVAENLAIKLAISGVGRRGRADLVRDALTQVGLTHRRNAPGRLLSGGEKQRLAVARAILTQPPVLLADEPTGNLDRANADNILDLFDSQARKGVAVVVITHDPTTARWADRALELDGGRLRLGAHG